MRSSCPCILALLLVACGKDSSSSELAVLAISVPDFGSWESNRPIEFAFNQRIDFRSVSGRSIRIRTSVDEPAAGTFAPKRIDADGDGAFERVDESVVVFYPRCPTETDLSDAGLTLGARYLVTLEGEDSGEDPATLLRSASGQTLAQSIVHAFETIADFPTTVHDERPGAPRPVLRKPGASTGSGCYLELGEDPANQVFFVERASSGRPPSGFAAPLDLIGDRATHVAFVLVLDQLIRATPENLARLWLEYDPLPGSPAWVPLETRVELVSNCRPDDVAVRLVPVGTFPPGGRVRAVIDAGFEDIVGEATAVPLEGFVTTEVARVAYANLSPVDAIADEIREEFDFGPGSPLSLADPVPPPGVPEAGWGAGELRANPDVVVVPPELREFDWVVSGDFVFHTDGTAIKGGPGGAPVMVQETKGGFVAVRDLVVFGGSRIRVRGPNPMVIHASGNVSIFGTIDASGFDAPDLPPSGTNAGQGGEGCAGGGAGGAGSREASTRGGGGLAAFGAGPGGDGGESGFAPTTGANRGGGGGGGRFAPDQGLLVAQPGGDGGIGGTGAESGLSPARGGALGPAVFTDGDPSNDFFGIQPLVDEHGAVFGRRRGELDHVHAGMGGGAGGDTIRSSVFPPPPTPGLVQEGTGGGGGGGALVIRALGTIQFGGLGQIRANGGDGGRRGFGGDFGGTCGGSGSGGHVILESATAIDLSGGEPQPLVRIVALGGLRILQGAAGRGAGGAGGPGVVQLHVPHPERPAGAPDSNVIVPERLRGQPDPLPALCQPRPHVLYPTVAPRSRALSRWIPLGAAGEASAVAPARVVAALFEGIETAPGANEGKVQTSGVRVLEPAPLLGPVRLAQPEVELLSDGASLALSGTVLAPLSASAEPISPDVYLRTPALLAGHTLRLANAAQPLRRSDLTIAAARYDDARSRLTLTAGGLAGTLADAIAQLDGADEVELALVPRFFRVRQQAGLDFLPAHESVRILFQGAAADGAGRPDELSPLVDWTADVRAFGALAPGALDFVRFLVEFEVDTDADAFDPAEEPLALEFLRLPLRF